MNVPYVLGGETTVIPAQGLLNLI